MRVRFVRSARVTLLHSGLDSGRPIAGSHSGESRSSECACVVYLSCPRAASSVSCVCVCGVVYVYVRMCRVVDCTLSTMYALGAVPILLFMKRTGPVLERDLRDHPAGAGGAALSRPTPGVVPVLYAMVPVALHGRTQLTRAASRPPRHINGALRLRCSAARWLAAAACRDRFVCFASRSA